jgi:ribosomal protein S18 acetylase RimI-like enzyme
MIGFRLALPGDVAALGQLARAAYAVYQPRMSRPPAPVTADYGSAVLAGQVWVAEEDARVLGMLELVPEPDALLLRNVAVYPDAQGRGIGAELLALAEREAGRRGLTEIRLYTNELMTENLAFYPRHGYRITGRAEQDGYRRVFFSKQLSQA